VEIFRSVEVEMAKDGVTKKRKNPKKSLSSAGKEPEVIRVLTERLALLEEAVERLVHKDFYAGRLKRANRDIVAPAATQDRFVRATNDGWLIVLVGGIKKSLPSGLRIALTQTSGGRDYGVVSEGILEGTSFDVSTGNLENAYRRIENLVVNVVTRPGGPVTVGGVAYDLELTLTYKEGGAAKSSGPFPSKTNSDNPLPAGRHDLKFGDYPHDLGATYGRYGTVWFHIGHSGDRYLHPGRVSAGCITCAPVNWPTIYDIVHAARIDKQSSGRLTFAP
jgi:hypothetical protein